MSEDSFEEMSSGKQFRSYLEECKVMKCLTEILLELYHEEKKPKHPLMYVKEKLLGGCKQDSCLWELKFRISEAVAEKKAVMSTVEELRSHNAALKQVIKKLPKASSRLPPHTVLD